MKQIRKIWPTPFSIKKGDLGAFIVQLAVLLLVGVVIGFLVRILLKVPVLGLIFAVAGSLVILYIAVGVILSVLTFLGVLR